MKEIKLTQGKAALVDDADFQWLNQWKWYAQNTKSGFYAIRRVGHAGGIICMHRLILGLIKPKQKADHKDRDTLNNQRSNLRIATHAENMSNRRVFKNSSSKYLGVHWFKRDKKWYATITKDNKKQTIGSFSEEDQAALAYNEAAKRLHGEFANLNQIPCGN